MLGIPGAKPLTMAVECARALLTASTYFSR